MPPDPQNSASEPPSARGADVLVIDDEIQIRRLLRMTLESNGYRVRDAETGQLGLNDAAVQKPDVIILDLSLPDMTGLEVLRRLREWSQTPVLILSVRSEDTEKIAALDGGADDYLTKPFSGGELLARLRVLQRRNQPVGEISIVRLGGIEIDFARRTVTRADEALHLTVKEYHLLRTLLLHRGKVVTHRQLLRDVWGPQHENDTHYLRVHMANLRKKLQVDPAGAAMVKTESGIGYRVTDE